MSPHPRSFRLCRSVAVALALAACTVPQPVHAQEVEPRKSADAAFAALEVSLERGDPQPFASLMTEDATFLMPMPGEWRGEQRGRARFTHYVNWRWSTLKLRADVLLDDVMQSGSRFAYLFRLKGTLNGAGFSNHLVVVFDMDAGRIASFQEYGGDAEPMSATPAYDPTPDRPRP